MKHLILSLFVSGLLASTTAQAASDDAADSTGLPGDHFSLEGALEMFKKATSMEEFEKMLNTQDNSVNNLDLNGDGEIDYIRVEDRKDGDVHAIVLQVPVNESESQDVAVIEIEKNGAESAQLQILGDEELYGENKIIEPAEEKDVKGTKKGPSEPEYFTKRIIINVWGWPCIRFIYAPAYVVWVSPWRWHHYPHYWKPWRPHPWRWHYTHCGHYRPYYWAAPTHRVIVAHKVYAPNRRTSAVVVSRHRVAHTNYKARKAAPAHRTNAAPAPSNRKAAPHQSKPRQQQVQPSRQSGPQGAPRGNRGGSRGAGPGGGGQHKGRR